MRKLFAYMEDDVAALTMEEDVGMYQTSTECIMQAFGHHLR